MKRTPLKRGKSMKRGGRIKAKGKPRFKRGRDPKFLAWIREQPCPFGPAEQTTPTEAAHVKSRGAGGADMGNTLPMCRIHHRLQHTVGVRSFEVLLNVDLKNLAAEYARRYLADTGRTA
jgi:hypothetical protein